MLKAIRIESKYDSHYLKPNQQRLFGVIGALLLLSHFLMACQGQSKSKVQLEKSENAVHAQSTTYSESNQAQKEDKKACKKIGERCRLRPGVLGVCSPSAPQNAQPKPWETAADAKRLHCTPQH